MKLNLKENYWVEIDPEIIQLANDYFKLNEIQQEIVIDDAFEFVLRTKEK
jgi:spermidine synthase